MYDFVIIGVHFNTILASFSFSTLFNIRSLGSSCFFSFFLILFNAFVSVVNVLRQWILFTLLVDPFCHPLYWKFMIRKKNSKIWTFSACYLLLIFIFEHSAFFLFFLSFLPSPSKVCLYHLKLLPCEIHKRKKFFFSWKCHFKTLN